MKEHYGALTLFIEPKSIAEFEQRIRARSPMSDTEWEERKRITEAELTNDAPWYDHRIVNADGGLDVAVDAAFEFLQREGFLTQ
jgi:guanylate kinase